jgi:hypothetical protein
MGKKSKPQPAPSNANEMQGEGGDRSARKRQDEQRQFPENEGLTNLGAREAADALGGVEGEARDEAARIASQRGRTA